MRAYLGPAAMLILSCAAVGCAPESDEDFDSSEADLSASQFETACSAPVRSDDGKYLALDLCPTTALKGRIVRVDVATGTQTEIAQYEKNDRVEKLSARGPNVFYAVRHAIDSLGRATNGIDVAVRGWSLESGRSIATVPPENVTQKFTQLKSLTLTEDGSHVAFTATDAALSKFVFVAPVSGDAAPKAIELTISSAELRWSTSGAALVGHDADATAGTGETLYVIDTAGEGGIRLDGSRHVAWTSFAFGQGGTRAQEPFDGTRVLGFKTTPDEASVGTVDPRTGEEKVLDAAPLLSIVTDLGTDILYSRVTAVADTGGFARALVRQSRAGGEKTSLIVGTGATKEELRYGFDPLALTKTGAYGVFGTRTGAGVDERYLVKLDGSEPATKLAEKVRLISTAGNSVLVEDASGAAPVLQTLDLATGAFTALGAPTANALPYLAGSGALVELVQCTTAAGRPGTSVKYTTAAGATSSECAYSPWASIPLATADSDAIVFYSSFGPFGNTRYDIGIVKP